MTKTVVAAAVFAFSLGNASANELSSKGCHAISVPPLNAAEAINALARQTGAKLLFPYDLTQSYRARPVIGCYTIQEAMNIMLKGSGLTSGLSDNGLYLISVEESNHSDRNNSYEGKDKMVGKKKNLLAVMISFLMGTSGAQGVLAQASAEDKAFAETLEEIEVVGIRASIVRALEQKRDAVGVSDSISAEDIGKFPDLNLSESLQRIPGVTLNRNVNGEGQAINVRGLGPQFTRVEVNGMSGTGNGSGGRFGNSEGGRGFNFELLASELFSNATVSKSISASQAEGGLAGTVSLSTPKPLDYEGTKATASVQGNYSETTGDTDPRGAAFFSQNVDGVFGVAASVAYSDTFFKTDTVESGSWRPLGNQAGAPLVANGTRLYNFTEQRDNLGSTVTLQYRPSENWDITLDGIYAQSDSERVANRDDMPIEGGQTGVPGSVVSANGVVTSGDFTGVQQRVGTNYFTTDEEFFQLSLAADWTPNDSWTVSPFIGFSSREAKRVRDLYSFRLADLATNTFDPGTVSYQQNGDYVDFSSDTTNFLSNPEEFLFNVFILRPSTDEDEEFTTKLDFEKVINDQGLTSIEFGVRYADRTKTRVQTQERLQRLSGTGIEVPPSLSSVEQLLDFDVSGSDSSLPSSILAANPDLIRSVFYPGGNAVAGTFIRPLPGFGAQNSWEIEEKTVNVYFQANFEMGPAQFDAGLRLVRTDQTSSGNTVENIFQPTERITPVSIDSHYTEYLPSASLRYELSDNLIVRAAYSTTLTRPNLPDLAPSESIRGISEVDGGTGSRGNPELKPFTANNFDVGVEWYFEDEAILSLNYFYKDISGLIDTTTFIESRVFPRQADGVLVEGDILFTQPENGVSANIEGFELGFQKPLAANFGMLVNFTYADSAADFGGDGDVRSSGLPGLSRTSYNASLYYDDGRFDARVSYAWRENYLAQFSDDFGVPRFVDDFGQLDLSANFRISDNLIAQLQVLNLTNEQSINQSTDRFLPYGVSELDRRALFGIRYSY